MSPPNETGAPERTPAKLVTTTAHPQDITAEPRNQTDTVLAMLMDAPAVCSSRFYSAYLPRFGARIWELRQQGYVVDRYLCDDPDHYHRNRAFLYELAAVPSPEAAR